MHGEEEVWLDRQADKTLDYLAMFSVHLHHLDHLSSAAGEHCSFQGRTLL